MPLALKHMWENHVLRMEIWVAFVDNDLCSLSLILGATLKIL